MAQQNIKKKHHFVFQAYLESWMDGEEKVWSLFRGNKKLHTKTDKIAFNFYFYSIKPINKDELDFLLRILPLQDEAVKRQFLNHIGHYQEPLKAQKAVEVMRSLACLKLGDRLPDEIEEHLQLLEHQAAVGVNNVVEDFHAELESDGMNWIRQLKAEGTSFYRSMLSIKTQPTDDDEQFQFLYFLCTQYYRTKAMKERWIATFGQALNDPRLKSFGFQRENINIENLVYPAFWLFISQTAFNLWRLNAHLTLLVNDTKTPFITCDQPVINIKANYQDLDEETTELVFYYPISPRIAITINNTNSADRLVLDQQTVEGYNKAIFDASYESIFANNEEMIDLYMHFPNNKC